MITGVLLVTVILLAIFFKLVSHSKYKNYPPGPVHWPIIGNRFLLTKLTSKLGYQHLAFSEICRLYNSDVISLRIGRNDTVIVTGGKNVHELLHNEDCDGRPWNEFIKLRNMGMKKGITMNDGADWKFIRTWVVRNLRNMGLGTRKIPAMILDELSVITDKFKAGGVYQLKPIMSPIVLNIMFQITTAKCLADDDRLQCFLNMMTERTKAFDMTGGILSNFPWLRYIAPTLTGYSVMTTINNKMKNFLMTTIAEHKKKYVPGKENDLIDLFIREQNIEENSSVFTDEQLVVTLMDLFLAAAHTTTSTLDFAFLNMVVHQDAQNKLHEEIDRVIGKDRLPDLSDKIRLPYAEAILTESQRMWTVVPISGPRRAMRDTELAGYKIPKDTFLLMSTYDNNMDPKLYPEPEKFKPERYIKNGMYTHNENLILFGKGRRRCPGEVLAKAALFLLFIGVMQKYRLLPVPHQKPPVMKAVPGLTISPVPYDVLIVPR